MTSFNGGAWTHSYKMAYRPINSLLLRATTGTSYRAPNLRELFLVPTDRLSQRVRPMPDSGRCHRRNDRGVHSRGGPARPDSCSTTAGRTASIPPSPTITGLNVYNVEVGAGGIKGLDEERSESLSAGFSFEQTLHQRLRSVDRHELLRNRSHRTRSSSLRSATSSSTVTTLPAASARSATVSTGNRTPGGR